MIKITYYSDNYCTVLFEVEPFRHSKIWESKLGIAIAKTNPNDYHISKKEDKIFKVITSIPCSNSIDELKIMKKDAQEEFSQSIQKLKKQVEQFKLLKELTKKEVKK